VGWGGGVDDSGVVIEGVRRAVRVDAGVKDVVLREAFGGGEVGDGDVVVVRLEGVSVGIGVGIRVSVSIGV